MSLQKRNAEPDNVGVAVAITRDALHGSGRAELRHPALASGKNAMQLDLTYPLHSTERDGSPQGVRVAFCLGRFPLASPLPSIPSAAVALALFGDFSGTTGLSDFPGSYIIGVRP